MAIRFSRVRLPVTPGTVARQAPLSLASPGKDAGVGRLQGISPTQGLNPHLFPSPVLAGGFLTTSATWGAHKEEM